MRTLLVCTLSAGLLGCACPGAQQVRLAGCGAQGCPQSVADNPLPEIRPAPAKPKVAAKKPVKRTTVAKTAKPSPAQPVKQIEKGAEKSASANPQKPATPSATSPATPSATPPETPSPPPSDTSAAVVQKAKTKIAASIEEPA